MISTQAKDVAFSTLVLLISTFLAMESRPRKLLDQVRDAIRLKHYSYRTEQSYVGWIRRYILFHSKQHPKDMGGAEVEAFLTHLAVERHVSASTQNQAFSALLFLYRNVQPPRPGGLGGCTGKTLELSAYSAD